MKVFSKFLFASLASLVSSVAVDIEKRETPLTVTLAETGNNAVVKATVTNTGSVGLNLFNKGTFLDQSAVEKLTVTSTTGRAAFEGIRLRISFDNLAPESFTALAPGQAITVEVNAAELHDLSAGGTFTLTAEGAIPYAEIGSTDLTGKAVSYKSNTLDVAVDGAAAAKVRRSMETYVAKRTVLSSDCSGSRRTVVQNALRNCGSLATSAASAASSGSASKFAEYFKTASRSTVAARLRAVASDCNSQTTGRTQTHCVDTYGACSSNVLAYTVPSANYIVYCNIFFNNLPALTRSCHAQDQATTVLHEETHAPGVYSPGTQDNGYGYAAATRLSASAALNNADSYALYANALYAGC